MIFASALSWWILSTLVYALLRDWLSESHHFLIITVCALNALRTQTTSVVYIGDQS